MSVSNLTIIIDPEEMFSVWLQHAGLSVKLSKRCVVSAWEYGTVYLRSDIQREMYGVLKMIGILNCNCEDVKDICEHIYHLAWNEMPVSRCLSSEEFTRYSHEENKAKTVVGFDMLNTNGARLE